MKLNLKKISERLDDVQARCSARTMDLDDIREFVGMLQEAREKALSDRLGRKYLQKVSGYKEYTVPNSYRWRAETTGIEGHITRYGRVVIHVYRSNAAHVPYGGERQKIIPIFE